MVFSASYPHITTDDSLMETVSHGSPDYPFHFYYENMDMFDFNCIDWHWHTELEFVFIESGNVPMLPFYLIFVRSFKFIKKRGMKNCLYHCLYSIYG